MRVVTVEQMRAIEAEAERTYGLDGPRLMANAGASAAQLAVEWLGTPVKGTRWLMLIGPGNNGGDGRIMANQLVDVGARVTLYDWKTRSLFTVADTPDLESEPATPHAIALALFDADVVVDALLGIGVSRPLGPDMQALNRLVRDARLRRGEYPKIIAVDVPSGMNADTGEISAGALVADLTITLAYPKIGQFWYPGAAYCGELWVGFIGLPKAMAKPAVAEMIIPEMLKPLVPARPDESNKGTYGKALIVAGSPRFPGAAVLAATACARIGTGLVTLATTAERSHSYVAALPEAVFALLPEAMQERSEAVLAAADKQDAVLVGPGLDQQPGTREWLLGMLAGLKALPDGERPRLLVDADGLNLLSQESEWWQLLPPNTVLTPHPGEFARLLGRTAHLAGSGLERLRTVQEYSRTWGHVVVLKGAITLIVAPAGEHQEYPWLNHAPNPAMATAGTGDVLAGTITGLLAQGCAPFDAAALGVALHSSAGQLAAHELGDVRAGMLAIEIAHHLPAARAKLVPHRYAQP